MRAVFRYINYYKDEHKATLKEATTLLELALWKANLDEKEKEKDSFGERKTKRAKVDAGSEKNEVKSHLVRI